MAVKESKKIWFNGKLINWKNAKVHVLSHVIHYGSGVFEGMRCYNTKSGPGLFRVKEHMERMINSAKIYRMEIPYSSDELIKAVIKTVKINKLRSCYVRPFAFRGYGEMGVNPMKNPIDTCIAVWEWGKYLGADGITKGIDVCVSSWQRLAPNTMPAMAKASSNYMNGQLIKMEALLNGYAEGIGLTTAGYVCEGSGENIFAVKDGIVYTPPLSSAGLPGITRNSVIRLLTEDLNIEIKEQHISREMLYIADEVFLTGSAAEITPVRSIDKIKIGKGKRGPVAKKLQDLFFGVTSGKMEDKYGWLTIVK